MTTYAANATDYMGAFKVTGTPDFAAAALLVIDMQNATGARGGALGRSLAHRPDIANPRFDRIEQSVVPNTRRMLEAFRAHGGRVIYVVLGAADPTLSDAPPHMRKLLAATRNWVGSTEHEIVAGLERRCGEVVLRKTTVGAFASCGIDVALRSSGVQQLYVCGVSTNMCVDTTAREAADRGYAVTLLEDACGAAKPEFHEAAIASFQRLFGRVLGVKEAIAELGLSRSTAAPGSANASRD
jgi:nicotinamidase-related amidase